MSDDRPIPLILDTDIGSDVDDALALVIAARHPRFDLRAVTTVNGNGDLRARVAVALLELLGRADVPVAVGREAPLDDRPNRWMPSDPGHDGTTIATAPVLSFAPAADLIAATVREADRAVTICCIGPVTNVVDALRDDPELIGRVEAVHLMGGCLGPYTYGDPPRAGSPDGEFNLGCDPTAAMQLFALPVPIRMAPIDVTANLVLNDDARAQIAVAGALGAELERQMQLWVDIQQAERPERGAPAIQLHDPLAVAGIVDPGVERTELLPVSVAGRPGCARTLVSEHGRPVTAVRSADLDALTELLVAAVTRG